MLIFAIGLTNELPQERRPICLRSDYCGICRLALYYFKPHGGFSNSSINLEQNMVWSVCLWQSFKCNKFFSLTSYSLPRSPGMKNHPVTTTVVRILQLIGEPNTCERALQMFWYLWRYDLKM